MSENTNNQTITDYIQFSKRVTRWGMILVSVSLLLCLIVISFFHPSQGAVNIIGKLYGSYITIIGVIIGAYQGNSSLEKWTKAKYQFSQIINDANKQQGE